MADRTRQEIDAVTGTATTGHEWDGIRNSTRRCRAGGCGCSTPRIVWAIGYWVVYPAWPLLTVVHARACSAGIRAARSSTDLAELQAQRGPMMDKLAGASLAEIAGDPQLLDFARADGKRGLRRQLRALSWRRRRRRQGLSQSQRRRLAVGRQARRHRSRRSGTACARRRRQGHARATCRPSAATAC